MMQTPVLNKTCETCKIRCHKTAACHQQCLRAMVGFRCVCRATVALVTLLLLGAFQVPPDIWESRAHVETSEASGESISSSSSNLSNKVSSISLKHSLKLQVDLLSDDNESKKSETMVTTSLPVLPVFQPGDLVPVTSPACGPDPSKYLPQDPCCYGTACCQNGMAKVLPNRKVTWTKNTEILIVAPQAYYSRHLRPNSRISKLSWITEQKHFPYVLCHFCSIEVEPMCSVKTNQGFLAEGVQQVPPHTAARSS